MAEIETYRNKSQRPPTGTPGAAGKQMASPPPVAQVAPVPRNNVTNYPQQQQQQPLTSVMVQPPPSQTPAGINVEELKYSKIPVKSSNFQAYST